MFYGKTFTVWTGLKEQYVQQKLQVTEYLIVLPRERESMGVFDNSKVCVCVCVWGGGGGGLSPCSLQI